MERERERREKRESEREENDQPLHRNILRTHPHPKSQTLPQSSMGSLFPHSPSLSLSTFEYFSEPKTEYPSEKTCFKIKSSKEKSDLEKERES
jgi:hypothetical protein